MTSGTGDSSGFNSLLIFCFIGYILLCFVSGFLFLVVSRFLFNALRIQCLYFCPGAMYVLQVQ